MKKSLLAILFYLVLTMILGMSWHFVFFKELYDSLGIYNRAEPIIPLGLTSMFIQGVILAYLYPRFYKGGNPATEGLKFGLLMGLFMFSISTLANGAKIQVTSMSLWLGVQTAFHLIQFVIAGLGIGFIFGKSPRT
ncbi:MAG: DUF1761 domain-containing protein [Bdellovibrionia bacterium]